MLRSTLQGFTIITTNNDARTRGIILVKLAKLRVAPRLIKNTTTKKSRKGRRRALISCAYGNVARLTPAKSAPISIENPATSNNAADPKPQPIENRNKNS